MSGLSPRSMCSRYRIDRMIFGLLFAILAAAAHWFKVSYLFGSHTGFLSATGIISPLTGSFFGASNGILILFLAALTKGSMFAFGGSLLLGLAQWVPGVTASMYLRTQSYLLSILLPLVCMGLFLLHPVGLQAWGYSLLWLIPVVAHKYRSSFFAKSLASTFIAHAVGSVLWIYGRPMMAVVWWGLVPVALAERVVMALGIVVAYKVLSFAKHKISVWCSQLHVAKVSV